MPGRSRPSIGRSLGLVAPPQSTTESFSSTSCVAGRSTPISVRVTNLTPSASIRSTRRCTTFFFSSFMLGIPYISRPPMRSARSYTVTQWPARLSWAAQAKPAGPEPTTATFLPVRLSGGSGTIQPTSKPLSTMAHSTLLIVTGGALIPTTQAPSQGAGQTRPVNSGKLLVLCSLSSASCHNPR